MKKLLTALLFAGALITSANAQTSPKWRTADTTTSEKGNIITMMSSGWHIDTPFVTSFVNSIPLWRVGYFQYLVDSLTAGASKGKLVYYTGGGSTKKVHTAPANINITTNSVNFGATTNVATAAVVITSTTQGFLLPVMTTTQMNAISQPARGLLIFNSDSNRICYFNNTAWKSNRQ